MEEKFKQGDEPKDVDNQEPEINRHEVEFTNDADVDKVVDQIVNEESDELLNAQDEFRERDFTPPVQNKSVIAKIKRFFKAWWDNKRLRFGTFIALGVLLIVSAFIPVTRYGILNLVGVRVSSSLTIVDSETGLPLQNIPVKLQGKEAKSNEDGFVEFKGLKQGASNLIVDKRGYALLDKKIVLGWGSNPLGEQPVLATGSQYTFILQDWLSKQPVKDGQATSGEDVAKSDDNGRITLTVGDQNEESEVAVSVEGYRQEKFNLGDLVEGENILEMVPSKKHSFVSNRSGEYDLYTIDVDGKNEKLLLTATGKEREVPYLLSHPSKDVIAFVSSRDGNVNKSNFILDGLFVIDVLSGESYSVTRSEQLQVIGWFGNKLIYVSIVEGVSAGNSQRSKLTSFDFETKERTDLASSNYFNDVKLINSTLYYAISSYAVPQSQAKLFSVEVDGKNKQTVINEQVWTTVRKDFVTLLFNAESQNWYEQEIGRETKKLDTQPVVRGSRIYTDSPNGKKSVWVDVRDGKGVLIQYDVDTKTETVLLSKPGLTDPVYWVNDSTIVYRVNTSQETADYIFSLDSESEPQKIVNVVGNLARYFYQ